MRATDQTLVRKTLAGDNEAFGQLVERYNRLVHGVILHKLRRSDEVEDLVQDVFCKAYQELPHLRQPDKFAPWLARMAANQAQAWLRRCGVRQICQQNEDLVLGAADPHSPHSLLEIDESNEILWEALDRLTPEYRQVLLLYHFEDCPQQDIARFLGITVSTVKWRLLRARQSLKVKLDEVFNLERRQVKARSKRLNQRIFAALPLLALFQPVRPRWGRAELLRLWLVRRALPLAYAALFAVGGGLIYEVQADQVDKGSASQRPQPIQVRLERASFTNEAEEEPKKVYLPCAAAKRSADSF